MGICCGKLSKEFYPDVEPEQEREIRLWEESIGAFKKTFTSLRNKSKLFEQNLISPIIAESYFEKEFSSSMVDLIKQPYFMIDDQYSSKKLNALVFLLTRAEAKQTGNISYYDKSTYIIQEILVDEEDNLNNPIEENDEKLRNFCVLLCDVSFEITAYFIKSKRLLEVDYFKDISNNKEKASDFALKNIFRASNKAITSFNNNDLSARFTLDKWFLTPGYFRESAYELSKLAALSNK